MIPLSAYVAVSAVLFITGLLGVLIRRNFIIVLMAVEIMLNAGNLALLAFAGATQEGWPTWAAALVFFAAPAITILSGWSRWRRVR